MDAHRVYVFHGADGENVANAVPQDLELNLLPSAYVLFYKDLGYGREHEAVVGYQAQLLLVPCNAAAGASQGVCRADYDGIAAYALCDLHALLNGVCDVRGHDRLVYLLHRLLEKLSVFRPVYCVQVDAYKLYAVLIKEAALCKLAAKGQARLPAESGKNRVRLFLEDYALQGVRC